MHLRDRPRCDRLVLERGEQHRHGGTELTLDDPVDAGGGLGRDVVEEAPQLVGQHWREQAGARCDELPKLREGGVLAEAIPL